MPAWRRLSEYSACCCGNSNSSPSRRFSIQPWRLVFADQRLGGTVVARGFGRQDVVWIRPGKVIDGTGNEQDSFFLAGIRTAV